MCRCLVDLQESDRKTVSFRFGRNRQKRYTQAFERFITPLQKKHFQKLVLSRSSTKHINDDFFAIGCICPCLQQLSTHDDLFVSYSCFGTWVGSTPEILLSGHGKEWHTVALAGTMPMQNEVMPMDWDKKNQDEQGYVADYIRRIIKKFGNKMNEKGLYTARTLVHLKKPTFIFLLKNTDNIGNLLQELHPYSRCLRIAEKKMLSDLSWKMKDMTVAIIRFYRLAGHRRTYRFICQPTLHGNKTG